MSYNIIYFVQFSIPNSPLWSIIIFLTYTIISGLPYQYYIDKDLKFVDIKTKLKPVLLKAYCVAIGTGGLFAILYFFLGIIPTESAAQGIFLRFLVAHTIFVIALYFQITYYPRFTYYWFQETKYPYDLISSKETDKNFEDFFDKLKEKVILERHKKKKKYIRILIKIFCFVLISFILFAVLVTFLMFW